jgi:hypothetical protein
LGPAAKAKEIQSSLSPVGKSLFLPNSFSHVLHLSVSWVPTGDKSEKKNKKEEGKRREEEKEGKKFVIYI